MPRPQTADQRVLQKGKLQKPNDKSSEYTSYHRNMPATMRKSRTLNACEPCKRRKTKVCFLQENVNKHSLSQIQCSGRPGPCTACVRADYSCSFRVKHNSAKKNLAPDVSQQGEMFLLNGILQSLKYGATMPLMHFIEALRSGCGPRDLADALRPNLEALQDQGLLAKTKMNDLDLMCLAEKSCSNRMAWAFDFEPLHDPAAVKIEHESSPPALTIRPPTDLEFVRSSMSSSSGYSGRFASWEPSPQYTRAASSASGLSPLEHEWQQKQTQHRDFAPPCHDTMASQQHLYQHQQFGQVSAMVVPSPIPWTPSSVGHQQYSQSVLPMPVQPQHYGQVDTTIAPEPWLSRAAHSHPTHENPTWYYETHSAQPHTAQTMSEPVTYQQQLPGCPIYVA